MPVSNGVRSALSMSMDRPILFVDDLLRSRARETDQNPVLAYPKSEYSCTDFELFTPRQLDRLTDGAAKDLIKRGLSAVVSKTKSRLTEVVQLEN